MDDAIGPCERGSRKLAAQYESVAFGDVHRMALPFLPSLLGCVLDVDAGSGRDAAAFTDRGWTVVVLGLPDDATGSLATLRGIILQDAKSATYKLALLMALTMVADRSASLVRDEDDAVVVPLGLLTLC